MVDWEELHKTITVERPHEKAVEFVVKYVKPGMRVLDLGCGKGRHALYCARKRIETHAVDISDSALESLRKECEGGQLFEYLKVVKTDIKELPFPDGYFDAIICVNVINHGYWRDVKQYFKEATRVLKKGGFLFVIGVPIEFYKEVKGPNTKEVEKGTFVGLNVIDGDIPHHLLTKDDIKELLKNYIIIKAENGLEYSEWIRREVTHVEIIASKQ